LTSLRRATREGGKPARETAEMKPALKAEAAMVKVLAGVPLETAKKP
jgi:hypothetical protein